MSKQARRRFPLEFKEQAVARLSAPGAAQSGVAKELSLVPTQLKTGQLELEAAGSAEAVRRQQAEARKLSDLRRENRRLKEELEVMRKASAFFAQWAAKAVRPRTPLVRVRGSSGETRLHRRPYHSARYRPDVPGAVGEPKLVLWPGHATASRRAARQAVREALIARIRTLFEASKERYGAPRIHAELVAQDLRITRKTVWSGNREQRQRPQTPPQPGLKGAPMSDNNPTARETARQTWSGQRMTEAQFDTCWQLSGVIEREIRRSGSFREALTDYAHAYARPEQFDALRAEDDLRQIFTARYGQTMNALRENLLGREQRFAENPDQSQALTHARTIGPSIAEGETMPFYRAQDQAAGRFAASAQITEAGAKRLMRNAYQRAEGRDLYDRAKALEEQHHRPKVEAERGERQARQRESGTEHSHYSGQYSPQSRGPRYSIS